MLELLIHGRDDGRLDCDEEILLRAIVLKDDRERVLNFTFGIALYTEETCHRLWSSEEDESLV